MIGAPPGAGKTTRVPPALLDPSLAIAGRILVLQPRRMAARAAARRIAAEQRTSVGDLVGYQVRFEQKIGPRTRIALVTEGILLRMLHDDPLLESVGAVVFDEFHERNLNSDLALGMVRRIQQTVRPQLKIVVMSARNLARSRQQSPAYLGDCPVIRWRGTRCSRVDVRYAGGFDKRPLSALNLASGVEEVAKRTQGDILVFLPGVGEIRQSSGELQAFATRHAFKLFELVRRPASGAARRRARRPATRRKIVLSTNVAETSLTIPGITAVVDSGLARQLRFDPSVGLDRLSLVPISKAAADQPRGPPLVGGERRPASVYKRLWDRTIACPSARPLEQPEIHRVDLAAPVLQLWSWGETDILAFPWFEPPSEPAVREQPRWIVLRAISEAIANGRLTEIGRVMARLPVPPRIGRLLIEDIDARCLRRGRALWRVHSFPNAIPFLRSGR